MFDRLQSYIGQRNQQTADERFAFDLERQEPARQGRHRFPVALDAPPLPLRRQLRARPASLSPLPIRPLSPPKLPPPPPPRRTPASKEAQACVDEAKSPRPGQCALGPCNAYQQLPKQAASGSVPFFLDSTFLAGSPQELLTAVRLARAEQLETFFPPQDQLYVCGVHNKLQRAEVHATQLARQLATYLADLQSAESCMGLWHSGEQRAAERATTLAEKGGELELAMAGLNVSRQHVANWRSLLLQADLLRRHVELVRQNTLPILAERAAMQPPSPGQARDNEAASALLEDSFRCAELAVANMMCGDVITVNLNLLLAKQVEQQPARWHVFVQALSPLLTLPSISWHEKADVLVFLSAALQSYFADCITYTAGTVAAKQPWRRALLRAEKLAGSYARQEKLLTEALIALSRPQPECKRASKETGSC